MKRLKIKFTIILMTIGLYSYSQLNVFSKSIADIEGDLNEIYHNLKLDNDLTIRDLGEQFTITIECDTTGKILSTSVDVLDAYSEIFPSVFIDKYIDYFSSFNYIKPIHLKDQIICKFDLTIMFNIKGIDVSITFTEEIESDQNTFYIDCDW